MKNYFSLKCGTPLPLLANVVYKLDYLRDANNIYTGKIIRHPATRIKEHGTSPSAVQNHVIMRNMQVKRSCSNFSVIDSGTK